MINIIVAGIGTDVGKTVAASILTKAIQGDYWKPIQCGNLLSCDSSTVATLANHPNLTTYPESYRFSSPLSPHYAAELEGITISEDSFRLPSVNRPLIIECAGGLLVPLRKGLLQLDLYSKWQAHWFLVSKHYLGSINHTLLTLEALNKRNINLCGLIFNGEENPPTERVILDYAKPLFYGRINPERLISQKTIQKYAKKWKAKLKKTILHKI
jgi:dethiobiotin synthetase